MIKKIEKKFIAVLCLILCVFAIVGCVKDDPEPSNDNYKVTFKVINEQKVWTVYGDVKEVVPNRRVSKPTDPVLPVGFSFTSWYENEDLTGNPWNFDTNIVTKDTTLYAGYRELASFPTDLKEVDEACSNSIYWTQSVKSSDSSYKVTITDAENKEQVLTGTYKFDETNHYVTFTPTILPLGGYYNVKVIDSNYESNTLTLNDVLFSGAGTKDNPYLIGNKLDFTKVNETNVLADTYFKLVTNITIETNRTVQKDYTFNGIFDGAGRTLTLENANCGAIYKVGEQGKIMNLTIAGSVSTTSNDSVGGLVDYNAGLIDSVSATLTVTSTAGTVGTDGLEATLNENGEAGTRGIAGGIVGTNLATGTIKNSKITSTASTNGVVKASIAGGAIVGFNKGTVSLCQSEGCLGAYNSTESGGKSLSNYSFGGGVCGINKGIISECSLEGAGKVLAQRYTDAPEAVIEGTTNATLGGIVGYNMAEGKIDKCTYSGIRVHGDKNIGGIAGSNAGTITNSFAEGLYKETPNTISYVGGRLNVGGIVGNDMGGTVSNCLSTVNVYAYTADTAYSISLNANNCVYLANNPNTNSIATNPTSVSLKDPIGTNNVEIDSAFASYDGKTENILVSNTYLSTLGNAFIFNGTTIKLDVIYEEEETVEVNLYNGTDLWKIAKVAETGRSINGPVVSGYSFIGWATKEDGEVTFDPMYAISLYDLEAYSVAGVINLYAKFELKEVTSGLTVSVWNKNYTWITETELANIKTGFASYLQSKSETVEINWIIETATAVADLGASVNSNGKIDIVIGSGTNIATTGGVQILVRAAILAEHVAASRQAALINDNKYAKMLYAYLTGIENATAHVTIYGDNDEFKESDVDSILASVALKPTITVPEGATFKGYALELNGKVVIEVGSVSASITYELVKDHLTNGKITLYPITEIPEKDKLVVSVWNKNYTWITEAELATIKDSFNTYLTSKSINLNNLEITWRIESATGVADLGASVNNSADVDIIIGCGANVTTTGLVTTIARDAILETIVTAKRQTALLNKTNSYAVYLYTHLTGVEDAQAEVSIYGDDTNPTVTVLESIDQNKATIPTITIPETKNFLGWATTADQTTPELEMSIEMAITYKTIVNLLKEGKVSLYPVFEDKKEDPIESTTLVVSVWNKNYTWITEVELSNIKTNFEKLLTEDGKDLTKLTITWRIESATKVADLATSVNTAGDVDIIVACGATIGEITYLQKASINLSYVAGDRQTALLTDNTLALALFDYLKVSE